jgi:hypothetical protein
MSQRSLKSKGKGHSVSASQITGKSAAPQRPPRRRSASSERVKLEAFPRGANPDRMSLRQPRPSDPEVDPGRMTLWPSRPTDTDVDHGQMSVKQTRPTDREADTNTGLNQYSVNSSVELPGGKRTLMMTTSSDDSSGSSPRNVHVAMSGGSRQSSSPRAVVIAPHTSELKLSKRQDGSFIQIIGSEFSTDNGNSQSSPRESLTPRTAELSLDKKQKSRSLIHVLDDVDISDDGNEHLETERVEFSRHGPQFNNDAVREHFHKDGRFSDIAPMVVRAQ